MKKQKTQLSYQQRILKVLDFIEKNVDKALTLKELAEVSCFSAYHFQRIFTALTGESVQAHIKRLRLQNAARALLYTEISITKIALDVGFSTPSSFSKAVKNAYGLSPKQLRSQGSITGIENPFKHCLITYEEDAMQHTIEDREDKQLFYVRMTGSYQETPRLAWRTMAEYAKSHNISLKDNELVGFALDDPAITDEEQCRFYVGIADLANPKPEGEFGVQSLEGGRFAVFEHHGHYKKINETFNKIFGGWLPNSGYELRNAPAFVHYLEGAIKLSPDMSEEQKQQQTTRLYIPIN